ncbi:MAG: tellurite resistance TerB C-terminal domain-containing protein [Thermosynechococcaceae cyanobacterium]
MWRELFITLGAVGGLGLIVRVRSGLRRRAETPVALASPPVNWQIQSRDQQIASLQKQLVQIQSELTIALAQQAEAETQAAELNQLATDRAIELVQLQADVAELSAKVAELSPKRTRAKGTTAKRQTDAPTDPKEPTPKKRSTAKKEKAIAVLQEFVQEPDPKAVEAKPLTLDLNLIEAKQAESAAAAQLLQSVFAEEAVPEAPVLGDVAGLNATQARFLQTLSRQITWNRQDLMHIAQEAGVLLDGVLEVLNELAFERCDEALTEGEDPIEINPDVLQELLS